ncbi:alkaline-phosphatase-like protein [Chaetomium strumarium]|uniref:Alkaline-phosphatase-like protein n=1 Tax=Chaetomium strumarium TaxID=1170767 RepID=A0AAJ0M3N2_9PEZI|nr:alkaline-phosphatase-like protein [Chaetomium strumarium]
MPDTYELRPGPLPLRVNSKNGGGRPNYIIFMPDQLRYDSLGCTQRATPSKPGFADIKTPHLDAFAARGSLFTNCFTQASVCSQSRCSMFTGTYPHVSGHRSLDNLIKPWEPNVLRSLKESGYHVACLAPRGDTFAPGVTELSVTEYGFLETPEFMPAFGKGNQEKDESIWGRLFYRGLRGADRAVDYDEALVRSALAWLECPPRDRPWVLFMPLVFPHCPFQVEEPFFSMYDRASVPDVEALPSRRTGYEPQYMRRIREQYGTDRATPDIWREIKATYYGMVTRLDEQFGRVMRRVDELGLWKDTVTMFFTDHGEYLGDHGLIEKWPSGLSDSLVHEPLIIGGAGLPEGQVITSMAEMVDLVPTMLEMSGIGQTFAHNGLSWVPLLLRGDGDGDRTKPHQHKEYAFSEGGFLESEEPLLEQAPYPYDLKAGLQHQDTRLVGKAVSLRDATWTYVYRLYEPAELYHRQNDPHELHNLAADPAHAHLVAKYEQVVLRWLLETGDVLPWTRDPRMPEVKLKSPREQMEERLKT